MNLEEVKSLEDEQIDLDLKPYRLKKQKLIEDNQSETITGASIKILAQSKFIVLNF